MIDQLQKELAECKQREKKLVQEFTEKIKELHRIAPYALASVSKHSSQAAADAGVAGLPRLDRDDMPMDEMADAARMERMVRTMEQMEQKSMMEELQRTMEEKIAKLRMDYTKQLSRMEEKIQGKNADIDLLKKQVETVEVERDYYRKQSMETNSSSPPPPPPSKVVKDEMLNKSIAVEKRSDVTPLQRLRYDRHHPHPNGNGVSTPQTCEMNTTFDSISAETGATDSPSPGPSSRLDTLFQRVTDSGLNSMYHLLKVVESAVVVSSFAEHGEDDNDPDAVYQQARESLSSESEKEFVDRIKEMFDHGQREHLQVIESLKTELEETYNALKEDDLEVTTMLEEKQNKIRTLEMELASAKESSRNHAVLENMLRMVAEEQKSSLKQFQELKVKLQVVEKERNALASNKQQMEVEQERAMMALRRLLVPNHDDDDYNDDEEDDDDDRIVDKESAWMDLVSQVEKLKSENVLLKKRMYHPSEDDNDEMIVTIPQIEYESLCQRSNQLEELDRQEKRNQKLNSIEIQALKVELSEAQKMVEHLKIEVATKENIQKDFDSLIMENKALSERVKDYDHLRDECDKLQSELKSLQDETVQRQKEYEELLLDLEQKENLQEQVSSLESKIEELNQRAITAEERLQSAREELNIRKETYEKELGSTKSLFEKVTAEKTAMEESFHVQSQKMMEECNQLEEKLDKLQEEIIDTKEEKLALKSKVREIETELERTRRIMSLMQETSDLEGTASQAILDLKEQLREKQDLLNRLRHCCEPDACFMIDDIESKVHMTLCLLDTNVLSIHGLKSITPFDFAGSATPREQLLERSLRVQRAENDQVRKDIEDLKIEKDQEISLLEVELTSLQGKYEMKNEMLSKKEQELKTLQSSLKEPCVGYISEDESDLDDIENELISKSYNYKNDKYNETCMMCKKLRLAKEAAEDEVKEKVKSLAEAKMIISSLELSNKNITENLRSRLQDSNAAIVSLLQQSKHHEKESAEFRKQLLQSVREKEGLKLKAEKSRDENVAGFHNSAPSQSVEEPTVGINHATEPSSS